MLSRQTALIYAMVLAARADREVTAAEIALIRDLIGHLPIFGGVDPRNAIEIATDCLEQVGRPGGLDQVSGQIRAALPIRLREAAHALSCDVIAAGGRSEGDQKETLDRVRAQLEVDPARARCIERLARNRCEAA